MVLESFETSLGNGRVIEMQGQSPDHWEDKDHAYIEVSLPRILGPDVDLNVHQDRVLIRIGR
jgi:hypothetical protein